MLPALTLLLGVTPATWIPTPTPAPPVHVGSLAVAAFAGKLPLCGLEPAKPMPEICGLRYRVSTPSLVAQAYVDQALGFYYSYVWMEAARSAETALRHDPECAYAYLILHRALEKMNKPTAKKALETAQTLLPKCNDREKLLITARLQELGMTPNTPPDERKKKAAKSLDELLTIYEDDTEGWFARAHLNGGVEGVPYYKALLQINPLHPGANHELVHFYEGFKRPALGWPYAEGYLASSPGIPHAYHMQSHLAMRIGKWDHTCDRSAKAIELQRAYHITMNVRPSEDHQYDHQLETLLRSLLHDGRYAEAKALQADPVTNGTKFQTYWFRLALATEDWPAAEAIVTKARKTDKVSAAYYAARLAIARGELDKATAEADVLRQEQQRKKNDKRLEARLWEVQGRLSCLKGAGEAGLKLLYRLVERSKDDYAAHAWGHGGEQMEAWGTGALDAGNAVVAEEAFQEALAHDSGSARAALGMQALCHRLGRTDEAERYGTVALRLWKKADPRDFDRLKREMIQRAMNVPEPTMAGSQ